MRDKNLLYKALSVMLLLCVALMLYAPISAKAATMNAKSKKGMQGLNAFSEMNCSHILDNLYISDYYSATYVESWEERTAGGVTYYLDVDGLKAREQYFRFAHDSGKVVYCVILLAEASPNDLTYLADDHEPTTDTTLYRGFNTRSSVGCAVTQSVLDAIVSIYAEDIDYWILGNEVNQREQYELGTYDLDTYAENYALAMTYLNTIAKKYNRTSKVLISIDHYWTLTNADRVHTRDFLDKVAAYIKENGDFDWGIAHHPYPDRLEDADFWSYNSNVTNSVDTPKITMNNISVLTDYMHKSEMLYNGEVRDICLTEVGFNVYELNNRNYNEDKQAAALARAYYIAEGNPDIKCFIYLSYADGTEEAYGLNMGLKQRDCTPRKAYYLYKYIDSETGYSLAKNYLSAMGETSYSSIIPGWSDIHTNPYKIKMSSNVKNSTKSGDTIKVSVSSSKATNLDYEFWLITGCGMTYRQLLQSGKSNTYNGQIRIMKDNYLGRHWGVVLVNVFQDGKLIGQRTTELMMGGTADSYTGFWRINGDMLYIRDGQWIDWDSDWLPEEGLLEMDGKKYCLINGVVQKDFTGIVKNGDEKYYYIENGVFMSGANGITKVNGAYYSLSKGVVDESVTNLIKVNGVWRGFVNGISDRNVTGFVYRIENGRTYFVKNGICNLSLTSFVTIDGNTYYVYNGKKTTTTGYVLYKKRYYKTVGGIVDSKYSTIAKVNGSWLYFDQGVTSSYTGFTLYTNGKTYLVLNGHMDFYDGLYSDTLNTYYIKGGKKQTTTGFVTIAGKTYELENGIVKKQL